MADKIYNILSKLSMWHILVVCIVTAELLTFFISFIASHILWGKMSADVLIIGVIDSFLVSLAIVSVLLFFIRTITKLYEKLRTQNKELSLATSEINTLQGIIPICMHCKQIRDDKGFWQRVETYIEERSDAAFSHGICPGCFSEFHPDIAKENRK